jgi:hypothetical protein
METIDNESVDESDDTSEDDDAMVCDSESSESESESESDDGMFFPKLRDDDGC